MPLDFKRMSPEVRQFVFPIELQRRLSTIASRVSLISVLMNFVSYLYMDAYVYFNTVFRAHFSPKMPLRLFWS